MNERPQRFTLDCQMELSGSSKQFRFIGPEGKLSKRLLPVLLIEIVEPCVPHVPSCCIDWPL